MTAQEIEAAKRLAQALIQFISAAESSLNAPKPPMKPPQSERMQSPAIPPSLLTSREAAKYLAVSPGTLFNWTTPRGTIPVVRFGAAVRYSVKDLTPPSSAARKDHAKDDVLLPAGVSVTVSLADRKPVEPFAGR